MENASKALLIAGSILIVILLIAVGMLVFGRAKDSVNDNLGSLDATTIQSINSQFVQYEGTQRGSNVKSLLSAVMANNATYRNDDASRVIWVTAVGSGKGITAQTATNAAANISTMSSQVRTSNSYVVTISYADSGLVNGVTISSN